MLCQNLKLTCFSIPDILVTQHFAFVWRNQPVLPKTNGLVSSFLRSHYVPAHFDKFCETPSIATYLSLVHSFFSAWPAVIAADAVPQFPYQSI